VMCSVPFNKEIESTHSTSNVSIDIVLGGSDSHIKQPCDIALAAGLYMEIPIVRWRDIINIMDITEKKLDFRYIADRKQHQILDWVMFIPASVLSH
jgi:hypothetical protein